MFLSNLPRLLTPLFVAAALALTSARADAQQPRIPPDARAYQALMIQQQAMQNRLPRPPSAPHASLALRAYRAPAPTFSVTVTVPDVPATYVTIRSPDGEVRRYPLARGVKVEYRSQRITLRPGESTTIRLTPVD